MRKLVLYPSGTRFNLFTVISEDEPSISPSGKKRRRFNVSCVCGKVLSVMLMNLLSGRSKNCGCVRKAILTSHGRHGSVEYLIWQGMKKRCMYTNHPQYRSYGGRSIKVCERWMEFTNFFDDMGERPSPQHSIDRLDVNGDYEPSNCRWATVREQANNKRNNHLIRFNGKVKTLAQWESDLEFKPSTLSKRLLAGWSVEKALTTPVRTSIKTRIKDVYDSAIQTPTGRESASL